MNHRLLFTNLTWRPAHFYLLLLTHASYHTHFFILRFVLMCSADYPGWLELRD